MGSDGSCRSVSLPDDGNTVAIRASLNNGNGSDSGHVRVYHVNGLNWEQIGSDIDGEADSDKSGVSVSLSDDGNTVAIGAPYNDGNGSYSGHVRVYHVNGLNWEQIGSDIDGEADSHESGSSVSLSADGNTVAIGAPYNDGNGRSSGHARIYHVNGMNWEQIGSDIDGEADSHESGSSVSLSADGNTVAIGAPYNDGNGRSSGHARIYRANGLNWEQIGCDIDGEADSH